MASSYENIIDLLKSYRWYELFTVTKDIEIDETSPIESQFKLSLKAMMLASLWKDNINSRKIAELFPKKINNPLIHFCITYVYLKNGVRP